MAPGRVRPFLWFPWPRLSPAPRATMLCWLIVASLSVGASLRIVHRIPATSSDLSEVRSWVDYWYSTGANPYDATGLRVDYLPHALLVLTPLRWLPVAAGPEWFAVINVVLSVVATWLLVLWIGRLSRAPLMTVEIVALVAMVLSVRPLRLVLLWGQTMPLSLLLFVMAFLIAPRRPIVSGACFALASFKVNLAAGFGLAMFLLGFSEALCWGLAILAGLTLITAAVLHTSTAHLVAGYLRQVTSVYGGDDFLRGATGVRTLLAALIPNTAVVNVLTATIGLGSLALVIGLARRARHTPSSAAIAAAAAILWSLVALPNQAYNVALTVPALWLVHWPETTLIKRDWARWSVSALSLVYLTPSLPFALQQRLLPWWFAVDRGLHGWLSATWPHEARLLVFVLFALCLHELWWTARVAPETPGLP